MHAQFWERAQGIILGYPFLAPFSLRPSPFGSQGSYCSTQDKVRAWAPWQPSQGSVPQSVPEGRKELVSLLALASRRTKGSIGIHSRGLDVHSWGGQLIPDLPRRSWCRMGERLGSSPRICCIVMVEEGKDMNVWLCSPGERCGASPRSLHLYTKEEGRRFLVGSHRGWSREDKNQMILSPAALLLFLYLWVDPASISRAFSVCNYPYFGLL